MDCADAGTLAEFWKLAIGLVEAPPPEPFATQAEWRAKGSGTAWLYDPGGVQPFLHLQEVPEPKTVPNRMHFDLVVSGEGPSDARWQRVIDEVARLRGAGASVLREHPGHHVVMADPEGNKFCVTDEGFRREDRRAGA